MSNITAVLPDIDLTSSDVTTTITASSNVLNAGSMYSIAPGSFNNVFTAAGPTNEFKAGTITIKGEGSEAAEFDAAFINDLKILLEVINDLPDQHPLGELKHDMRMRRAFKRLGG
jgi:hypothetical protein